MNQKRDHTNIPHITVARDGTAHCERCGATYKATDEDVIRFNMEPSRRFMAQHRDCRPKSYVS